MLDISEDGCVLGTGLRPKEDHMDTSLIQCHGFVYRPDQRPLAINARSASPSDVGIESFLDPRGLESVDESRFLRGPELFLSRKFFLFS